jgi:hypothetical protein
MSPGSLPKKGIFNRENAVNPKPNKIIKMPRIMSDLPILLPID